MAGYVMTECMAWPLGGGYRWTENGGPHAIGARLRLPSATWPEWRGKAPNYCVEDLFRQQGNLQLPCLVHFPRRNGRVAHPGSVYRRIRRSALRNEACVVHVCFLMMDFIISESLIVDGRPCPVALDVPVPMRYSRVVRHFRAQRRRLDDGVSAVGPLMDEISATAWLED